MEGNSILEIARGEILECIDGQMQAIWENILDTETEATVTRKLTVTILLTPDEDRETVGVRSVTKATLAPRETAQASPLHYGKRGAGRRDAKRCPGTDGA